MNRLFCIFILIFSGIFLVLFLPFLWCFTYPSAHDYVHTEHPKSPFIPPSSSNLTADQISIYEDDGVLILRNVMPKDIMDKLSIAADDLATNQTLHCAMARYSGPPIFHKYSFFCIWPDMVHDYFRDALLYSPLSSVASQLMNNQPVRMFNTFTMGNEVGETIPIRWHADHGVFTGGDSCDNGLVMWMPIKETSVYEANGMMFASKSHKIHQEIISNGTWASFQSSITGLLEILGFYKSIGETYPIEKPTLHVGDVVIFSKCTVHSASGINSLNRQRYAWQIRFLTDPQKFQRGLYQPYPELGDKFNTGSGFIDGVRYPKVFPSTLPEEDIQHSGGHVTLSKMEWLLLMLSYPDHLLVTNFVRTMEYIGAFNPHHPLLKNLAALMEYFRII